MRLGNRWRREHGLDFLLLFDFILFFNVRFSVGKILLSLDLIELLEHLISNDALLVSFFLNIQILLNSLKL